MIWRISALAGIVRHIHRLATARGKAHIVFGGAPVYVTFDIDEIAPQYDATMITAQVGAQMLFEIFALMTLNPDWQRGE